MVGFTICGNFSLWWVLRGTIFGLACLIASLAMAADPDDDEDDAETTSWHERTTSREASGKETWSGASAMHNARSVYWGTTLAPFGTLQQDGVRLRNVTQMAMFSYAGRRYSSPAGDAVVTRFRGVSGATDLLAGYQWSSGALTAKGFVGATWWRETVSPHDDEAPFVGRARGGKGVLELWYNLSASRWAALDASYATPLQTYSLRLRAAQKFGEDWSVGGEASAFGSAGGQGQRLGAFLRFDDGVYELSAAGGWHQPDTGKTGAYGGVQWLRRF